MILNIWWNSFSTSLYKTLATSAFWSEVCFTKYIFFFFPFLFKQYICFSETVKYTIFSLSLYERGGFRFIFDKFRNFYTLFVIHKITICNNNTSHSESLQPYSKKFIFWCWKTQSDYWWKRQYLVFSGIANPSKWAIRLASVLHFQ